MKRARPYAVLLALAACERAPEGMVWIPAGTFAMGCEDWHDDSLPVHEVTLQGFWIDRTEVTNVEFARFIAATGYVTDAERALGAAELPGVAAKDRVPGSLVFRPPADATDLREFWRWWAFVPGACWRHPEGPGSHVAGRERHPVVHVSWNDASAYARWADKRLPSEAEWERAARGGLARKRYVWGDEPHPSGTHPANIWQGAFPRENTQADGFAATAPVGSFATNGFGLYDISGNVWEWCADWYRADAYRSARSDPDPASMEPERVMRGGSFLCNDAYCEGYRPGARMKSSPITGLCHTGFRCAR